MVNFRKTNNVEKSVKVREIIIFRKFIEFDKTIVCLRSTV